MFKKALATVGLLGWSVYASATTIVPIVPGSTILDVPNQVYSVSHPYSAIGFTDVFQFTIPTSSAGQAAAVAMDLNFGNLLNISGFTVTWDVSSPIKNVDPFTQSSSYTTAAGVLEAASWHTSGLLAGTYIFDVMGTPDGLNGGAYSAFYSLAPASSVTPVPLPSAVWLLGSALAGLVSFGRRSKKIG